MVRIEYKKMFISKHLSNYDKELLLEYPNVTYKPTGDVPEAMFSLRCELVRLRKRSDYLCHKAIMSLLRFYHQKHYKLNKPLIFVIENNY